MAALIGPLAVYVPTLTPGVDFWDTGEMQTVPYVLGIAHPTGFPLFVLAGFAFGHLFPIGDPAWRLSLFSALATATASWLLFVFVRDVCGDALLGTAGAWAFALGDIVWTRAVRAEVHDVALACTALALVAAARAGASRAARPLVVAALALGAGIAVHPVVALAIPAAAAFAWPALAASTARTRLAAFGAALLPLASYAYIPLRSAYVEAHALDPSVALGVRGGAFYDYASPATPAAFARYVSGAAFHPGAAFASVATPSGLARALALTRDVLLRDYGIVTLALAFVGFAYLCTTAPRLALGAAVLVLGFGAFAPNFAAESDVLRYALPSLWIVAACAAFGAAWLMHAILGTRTRLTSVFAAAMLAVGLWPSAPLAARDVRRLERFEDARSFAREIERRTADGSVVVATWPYATPLAYEAYVARRFGRRHLVAGWPAEFASRYRDWRRRFGRVYVVLDPAYGVAPFARRLYATERWQLAEPR